MTKIKSPGKNLSREIQSALAADGFTVPYMVILHRVRTELARRTPPINHSELSLELYTHFAEGKP